jgi:transposase
MASLDIASVRTEVSRLKADFENLCTEGKITSESKALMMSMFLIIELILSIFLERTTKKDNKNSSIPSSQTEKDESALGHQGSNAGKGKNENDTLAKNTRVHVQVSVSTVSFCAVCAEDLTDVPCTHHERRTKIDIIFEKVVEHVDAEVKLCPTCKTTVKGKFPAAMHGPLQYGD